MSRPASPAAEINELNETDTTMVVDVPPEAEQDAEPSDPKPKQPKKPKAPDTLNRQPGKSVFPHAKVQRILKADKVRQIVRHYFNVPNLMTSPLRTHHLWPICLSDRILLVVSGHQPLR